MEAAKKYATWIGLVVAAFILGVAVEKYYHLERSCMHEWDYLNETAACDDRAIEKHGYAVLKDNLLTYIEQEKQAGHLAIASVYFRDLKAGPTMGINEAEPYVAASLLKLPIAIAVYSQAEAGPDILSKNETLSEDDESDLTQYFKPRMSIENGVPYALGDLTERMLRHSDNGARNLVVKALNKMRGDNSAILTALRDLGMLLPTSNEDETISVRAYASLFRLLYNASYLNEKYSEHILGVLTESDFDQGLEKGVPENIKVAHKFGERWYDNKKQLHDCGIVFFPKNPYLLCVLTEGDDFNELADVIAEISRRVYLEVESRKVDTMFDGN